MKRTVDAEVILEGTVARKSEAAKAQLPTHQTHTQTSQESPRKIFKNDHLKKFICMLLHCLVSLFAG